MVISGGTAGGTGVIDVSGAWTFSSGTVSTTLTANGTTSWESTSFKTINGSTVTLNGTGTWTAGSVRVTALVAHYRQK